MPDKVEDAIALLQKDGAMPIAGGTDFVALLNENQLHPQAIIDISAIGLNYIRQETELIRIGATTTFAEILESSIIWDQIPVLAEAARQIGSVQTRNVATIGGNLCSAVPSADSAPPLLVLDAILNILGETGLRSTPLSDFFVGPRKTVIKPGEILVDVLIPIPIRNYGAKFAKQGRRKALTLSVVNTASLLQINPNDQRIEKVRVALGAVAPTPIRAYTVEEKLEGERISEALIESASTSIKNDILPIDDLRASASYRLHISSILIRRTLRSSWQKVINSTKNDAA